MDVEEYPENLVIIGSGFIGLEFAATYAQFGTKVTVVDVFDTFLPREDDDVSSAVKEQLESLGISFNLGIQLKNVHQEDGKVIIQAVTGEGTPLAFTTDAVLVATGRRANIQGLDLDKAGVAVSERGTIQVNEFLQTNVPHIFAMGDVNGGPQFTFVSLDDFRIVKRFLAGDTTYSTKQRAKFPTATFINPPLASVGLNEKQAKEAGIEVVAQPQFDVESMEKGQDWIIKAEVVTKPEVKLGAYKDLEVTVEATKEVTDAEVDERIERERNNLAELVLKEGPAADGDTVVIDFVGSVDGVEFDGGKGDNFSLGLGSGQFIPGFEEQLVGHSAGETVDVVVTFPEDYQAEDLAGKEAKFVTTIHEVKEKEVPALDDELAKDIDEEVETLDELKEKYRKELSEAKETAYKDAVEAAAIDQAVANAEIVELPSEMVHEEVHRAVNEFLGNMQRQGISPDMYFQITGTTQEDLHKQYEADAESRTKTNLVVEAVAKAEGFEASAEEIEAEVTSLATDYNMEVERVRQLLSEDMLKHDIAIKKAVEVITSTAKVK